MHKLLFSLLMVILTQAYALPDDKEKPVHIESDSADLSQSAHTAVYRGHVCITQGSSVLRAHRVKATGNTSNQMELAVAYGDKSSQAHFETLPESNKPMMHAYANKIRYHPNTHLIELIGNARVVQGKHSFSAPLIKYDMLKQHVISESKAHQRSTMIFYPEKST